MKNEKRSQVVLICFDNWLKLRYTSFSTARDITETGSQHCHLWDWNPHRAYGELEARLANHSVKSKNHNSLLIYLLSKVTLYILI